MRTRFAPSPTGMIHIGNLRTALYSYLISKHNNGQFILRIEDTDKERSKQEYIDYIYKALNEIGLSFDESPFHPNEQYAPYIQSERVKSGLYLKYAKQLIEQGDAYYCFCDKNDDNSDLRDKCRNLTKEEIEKNLQDGKPYVIRQKIPSNQIVKYHDEVYGDIEINSDTLDDQVLIKRDGYPTYNFANVIDDHLMDITHIVRGNEYISSTPKYILLYNAFKWSVPCFIHLPLIYIKDEQGHEQKLSKRFNCASFEGLINDGYLSEAIINYIVRLGWGTSSNQEIYSLKELEDIFEIKDIGKAHKVLFDIDKLNWYNHEYIVKMSDSDFIEKCKQYFNTNADWNKLSTFIKNKVVKFSELNDKLYFLNEIRDYSINDLMDYKKHDYNIEDIKKFIDYMKNEMKENITSDECYDLIKKYAQEVNINFGSLMYIYRIIICNSKICFISATEVTELIGLNEIMEKLNKAERIIE